MHQHAIAEAPRVNVNGHAGGTATDAPASLEAALPSDEFLRLISRDFARAHLVLSRGCIDGTEHLWISSKTPAAAIYNVGVRLRRPTKAIFIDDQTIAQRIDEAYGRLAHDAGMAANEDPAVHGGRVEGGVGGIDELLAQADRDLLSTQGKGPIIKLVDALLFEALTQRASDVHIQPLEDRALFRYRLDGVLHTEREIPKSILAGVTSRIKVMGRMDIAEKRIPQDGRASVTIGERSIDLRISTLPTSYGERCVIRLLDNTSQLSTLEQLGMPRSIADKWLDRAGRSTGILLLTGPTGSGKTTTLYSTLRRIGSSQVNIMTIEDPIEYELSTLDLAVSQSQVNSKKGVTFASGLRHILRQDPDVIMVGEIRDGETARIAVQASLTGHLVLSTLHTNDAPSAITRLADLGVEPYLVSAALSAVMAQRLVRLTHQPCRGSGCEPCFGTGFKGRCGLFELLCVDENIRELISRGTPLAQVRAASLRRGMRTLQDEGNQLVERGRTTAAEVARVVHGAD